MIGLSPETAVRDGAAKKTFMRMFSRTSLRARFYAGFQKSGMEKRSQWVRSPPRERRIGCVPGYSVSRS
jgi:hypothetical protein